MDIPGNYISFSVSQASIVPDKQHFNFCGVQRLHRRQVDLKRISHSVDLNWVKSVGGTLTTSIWQWFCTYIWIYGRVDWDVNIFLPGCAFRGNRTSMHVLPCPLQCSGFSVIQIILCLHWESQRLLSTVAKVKLQLGNILFPGSRLILLIGDNHLWREATWSLPVRDLEETLSLQEWHASIYFRTQYCALLWVINKIWDYHLTWVLLGLYWDGERP